MYTPDNKNTYSNERKLHMKIFETRRNPQTSIEMFERTWRTYIEAFNWGDP